MIDTDINNRSVRLHRLQKIRMSNGGSGEGVCRSGCSICRLIRKGEMKLKRHGLRTKRSWKDQNRRTQYK